MFKQQIKLTAMSTPAAINYFSSKISGGFFGEDVSWFSTAAALVAPRLKSGEQLSIYTYSANFHTISNINSYISSMRNYVFPNALSIVNLNFRDGTNQPEVLEKHFADTELGIQRLEKVTLFFKDKFYVSCFVCPGTKSTILFVEKLPYEVLHYLQCAIFAYLPWYFDPKDGCLEEDRELIESLREKKPAHYLNCLEKYAAKFEFEREYMIYSLSKLANYAIQQEKQRREKQITDAYSVIRDYERVISDYFTRIEDDQRYLIGLEARVSEDDNDLPDYFSSNKSLQFVGVSGSELNFYTKTYCEYYDEDIAKDMINNKRSYIYHNGYDEYIGRVSAEEMEALMRAVFIDNTIKLRFCAGYRLDQASLRYSPMQGISFPATFDTMMPNPHIQNYGCLGNYSSTILEALKKHDMIGAIEQCIASCRSLNFSDVTVMRTFMDKMYRSEYSCLELPDGTIVDSVGAVTWLNKNTESKEEDKKDEQTDKND